MVHDCYVYIASEFNNAVAHVVADLNWKWLTTPDFHALHYILYYENEIVGYTVEKQ